MSDVFCRALVEVLRSASQPQGIVRQRARALVSRRSDPEVDPDRPWDETHEAPDGHNSWVEVTGPAWITASNHSPSADVVR